MTRREKYKEACRSRYASPQFQDAMLNWDDFEAYYEVLSKEVWKYKSGDADAHSLSDLLWKLQDRMQPDKSCLAPFLDFCDHYQRCFLRRGLMKYCEILLEEIREAMPK